MDSSTLHCPACGMPDSKRAAFCRQCGAPLAPADPLLREAQQAPLHVPPPGTLPPAPPQAYQGYSYAPPPPRETDTTGGIIPYKNPHALAAYYMAVFALIPYLGLVLGPMALYFGLSGWRYYKQYPIVRGQVHAWIGIIGGGGCCLGYLIGAIIMLFSLYGLSDIG